MNELQRAKDLLNSGRATEAFNYLKEILPTIPEQDKWQVHELIGATFHDLADAEGAVQAYLSAAQSDKYLRSQREHFSSYLFALHYLPNVNNEDLANEHFVYNNLFREVERLNLNFQSNPQSIKIGYIAPHFLESSAARFFEGLLTAYDKANFSVTCFSLSSELDKFTELIKSSVDKFITLEGLSIEEAANLIASESVEILFDLGGHNDGGMTLQIMSYKPARVQISGIGWFDTTGLAAVDYILTDNYLAPIGHEKYFSEKLLRLQSAFAFKPSEEMIKNSTLNIPVELTFGCFNNFMKITDDYLNCVKEILKKLPDARFIMQDTTRLETRRGQMIRRLEQLKMPLDRIEVRLGNDNYLKDYSAISIMLDTFPYNGGAMTATALYMNVPVVSLYGTRHSSRFGADILRLADLTELIANDTMEFIKIAVAISDRERLKSLKMTLHDKLKHSKLMNVKKFVAEMENDYKNMIR